jgi:hypothetical protein
MPNGRGALECCYCSHFQSSSGYQGYDCAYEAGTCNHWNVEIPAPPSPGDHRICADFAPNEDYEHHNRQMMEYHGQTTAESVKQRMSWFGIELKPGVLYVFCYNQPPGIEKMVALTDQNARLASDE